MAYPFRRSPNFTASAGRAVDLVVIHTMEIDETDGAAEACASWFARVDAEVSAHYCVDADSVVQCVSERNIAWHARGGNSNSLGIELAARAAQSKSEWADDYSRAMLERASRLTAEICSRRGIPVRWLRARELRRRERGITGHADISEAFGRSDHWDPGQAFPVERFLALVASAMSPKRRSATRAL